MKKIIAICLIVGMLVLSSTSVFAAQEGKGTGDQTRTQDKLQDGSCLLDIDNEAEAVVDKSGDCIRLHDKQLDQLHDQLHDQIRDRLHDGSCQVT